MVVVEDDDSEVVDHVQLKAHELPKISKKINRWCCTVTIKNKQNCEMKVIVTNVVCFPYVLSIKSCILRRGHLLFTVLLSQNDTNQV